MRSGISCQCSGSSSTEGRAAGQIVVGDAEVIAAGTDHFEGEVASALTLDFLGAGELEFAIVADFVGNHFLENVVDRRGKEMHAEPIEEFVVLQLIDAEGLDWRAVVRSGFSMMRETSMRRGLESWRRPAIVPKPLRWAGPMRLTAETHLPRECAAMEASSARGEGSPRKRWSAKADQDRRAIGEGFALIDGVTVFVSSTHPIRHVYDDLSTLSRFQHRTRIADVAKCKLHRKPRHPERTRIGSVHQRRHFGTVIQNKGLNQARADKTRPTGHENALSLEW